MLNGSKVAVDMLDCVNLGESAGRDMELIDDARTGRDLYVGPGLELGWVQNLVLS